MRTALRLTDTMLLPSLHASQFVSHQLATIANYTAYKVGSSLMGG